MCEYSYQPRGRLINGLKDDFKKHRTMGFEKKENVREREIEEIAYLLNNLMGDRRGVNRL